MTDSAAGGLIHIHAILLGRGLYPKAFGFYPVQWSRDGI
jgi:hypothetical protein